MQLHKSILTSNKCQGEINLSQTICLQILQDKWTEIIIRYCQTSCGGVWVVLSYVLQFLWQKIKSGSARDILHTRLFLSLLENQKGEWVGV